MSTKNNVAAQAGDEPMRLVSANLLDRAVALLQSSGQMGVAHQLKECVSPRATADVERVALEFAEQLVRMQGYVEIWMQVDHACAECIPGGQSVKPGFQCGYHQAKSYIATTKPGA